MNPLSLRIASVATRIQTPLALAGFALFVLYGLATQVLKLNVFSNIGGANTMLLLNGLLNKLFILALTSLAFAAVAFLANTYLRARGLKSSHLELVDARLDAQSSDYVQRVSDDGAFVVQPKPVGQDDHG
jgi:hypothetical protein